MQGAQECRGVGGKTYLKKWGQLPPVPEIDFHVQIEIEASNRSKQQWCYKDLCIGMTNEQHAGITR